MGLHQVQGFNDMRESLWRWVRLAGSPGASASLTSILTLAGLSLLYRELPSREAGNLAILLSLADIFSLFALLGVGTVITRLYTPAGRGQPDWRADLLTTGAFAAPALLVLVAGAALIYEFAPLSVAYLAVVTLLDTLLAGSVSMLNARGEYAWAAVVLRAPKASFVFLGAIFLLDPGPASLPPAFALSIAATAAALLASAHRLNRILPSGRARIAGNQRRQGIVFMLSSVTDLVPEQGLIALAGRILPLNEVAAFAAIAVLIRPFRMVRSVLAMILAPDVIRHRRPSYARLSIGIWLLATACGTAAVLLVPPFAGAIYGPRYERALPWVPYLALAGAMLLGVILPRVDLGARASIREVGRFSVAYGAAMLLALAASGAVLISWGSEFLGVSVLLLQLAEVGTSYAFWFPFRRRELREC